MTLVMKYAVPMSIYVRLGHVRLGFTFIFPLILTSANPPPPFSQMNVPRQILKTTMKYLSVSLIFFQN